MEITKAGWDMAPSTIKRKHKDGKKFMLLIRAMERVWVEVYWNR